MQVLAWLSFMALGVLFFGDQLKSQYNPNRKVETLQSSSVTEVRLQRNRLGHYVTAGTINNREVTFLLDTGATGRDTDGCQTDWLEAWRFAANGKWDCDVVLNATR